MTRLERLDHDAFIWVVEHRIGVLDPVFVVLSVVGYAGLLWIALAPLVALHARLPVLRTTLLTAACVWTADLLALALKIAVGRPRPVTVIPEADPLLTRTVGDALPSGHAATSFAGAVLLGLVAPRAAPYLLALAIAVAYSRIYVGVHYPGDVLAGAVLGAAVGAAFGLTSRRLLSADLRESAAHRLQGRSRCRSHGPRAGTPPGSR